LKEIIILLINKIFDNWRRMAVLFLFIALFLGLINKNDLLIFAREIGSIFK